MDIDMFIYTVGALFIASITIGFLFWSVKTRQFNENEHVRNLPLKEDEEI
jgi:cbb3-type cytochrome oxidase maturation protein